MFFIKINELFIIILRNKTYRGFKMIKIDDKKIIVSFFDELKKVLEEYKLKVLRFTNTDVLQRFYSVCTVIDNEVKNILKISPSVTA